MVDRPEVEALKRRLAETRSRVLDARPRGVHVTGDVQEAWLTIVLAEREVIAAWPGVGVWDTLSEVLPDLDREDVATWRWLCGWEEHTVARLVCMLRRAGEVARG